MADDSIVLMGVGDVGPIHEPMEDYTTLARPVLATADIRFGQCERLYSTRGSPQLHSGHALKHGRLKPHMASIFRDCGFDVVSLASNHAMDFGAEALMETIDVLRNMGIQVVGAGKNIEEARRPVIIERKGVRVAFLAYCSVLNEGFAAGPNSPGAAPMRAHTYFRIIDYQPGTPPVVVTVPYEDDLKAMLANIGAVRKSVDTIVLSMHWGLHYVPKVICDYQPIVANAAFEAGADVILGHHAHVPKGIGVHGGKACFYSLSNFIMSSEGKAPGQLTPLAQHLGVVLDPEYPRLPYGLDAKRSLIAKAVLSKTGVKRASFLPVLIDKRLRPEVLRNGDARFDDAVRYMDWASEKLDHKFSVEGDEVIVC